MTNVPQTPSSARTIIVVGHGMVGQRLVEKLVDNSSTLDKSERPQIVVFGEEVHPAYDRVKLTSYFEHFDAQKMHMQDRAWYDEHDDQVSVLTNERVVRFDSTTHTVFTQSGKEFAYDELVLATGSVPFVPPFPGICVGHVNGQFIHPEARGYCTIGDASDSASDSSKESEAHVHAEGVFVYRTINDLDDMVAYAQRKNLKSAAVIGGGLLGLEAMRVCSESLKVEKVSVIDMAEWPMRRQLDDLGGFQLIRKIEELGYNVLTEAKTNKFITTDGCVSHLDLDVKGEQRIMEADLVIIAAGIRPRDDLGRTPDAPADLMTPRGGFAVDDGMKTAVPNVYAVGECAVHRNFIYGLVAPCYEQAGVLAYNLVSKDAEVEPKEFTGGDLSTKLKLMGVDVAGFGEYATNANGKENRDDVISLVYQDPFQGIYRKLTLTKDGQNLLGGILVGDASDYATLAMLAKSSKPLKVSAASLLPPPSSQSGGGGGMTIVDMDDDAQVCSCNDVSKLEVCESVRTGGCETVDAIVKCTKAGSSCGGCKPSLQELLSDEMSKLGKEMDNTLCPHFAYTRQELFHLTLINEIKSFDDLYDAHATDTTGTFRGCETCRPAVASILASLWNDLVVSPANASLQDTNDRFLGNIQRGGSYSVVPRIAAGEITPEMLIVLGQVAKKYGLYTKVTGGQRIDLFGAEKHQLPDIWEELVNAGFESGHAYGKSLRTVKSCVGSTWCRYGMRDSVGFALELESRYKGVRSPHKLKGGVSGCTRECAEAQSKDFGLIATAEGYNLYLGGNGGTKPRHAELFASGIDEETCRKYIDRFLILYIRSADKLQRTARWVESLEGGMEYLKDVIINDKLGICAELEEQMARLIGTYKCEWAEVVKSPERRKMFVQYANQPTVMERGIDFIDQRNQKRPANWPSKWESIPHPATPKNDRIATDEASGGTRFPGGEHWVDMVHLDDIITDSGVTLRHGKSELALFKMRVRQPSGKDTYRVFCTQNMCPHKNSFVLSSGLLGDAEGQPKVACPIHKKKYLLNSGKCMDDERYALWTFDARVDGNGRVSVRLPSADELDKVLANDLFRVTKAMGDAEEKEEAKNAVEAGGDSPRSSLDW